MDGDKAAWGLAEWRSHARVLEAAHESAMNGWGKTVLELESTFKTLDELMAGCQQLRAQLALAVSLSEKTNELPAAKVPEKRRRGRPKKAIDDSWLLGAFNEIRAEFVAVKKLANPTDGTVLTWYFGEMFSRHGSRASKASSAAFQAKLKTVRNRLSDARHPIGRLPVK